MKRHKKTLVAAVICGIFCISYAFNVNAEEAKEKNYLTDSEYKKFGMSLEDPEQFTDTNNDPLKGYEPYIINELFISANNNDDAGSSEIKNGFFFQENALKDKELEKVLQKDKTISSGTNKIESNQEWQMTNSVAVNLDGNEYGTQDIVQMACLYDKTQKKGMVHLFLHQQSEVIKVSASDVLSTGTESYVLDYTLDETAGYTAMAAGDYDGDGKDEVAFYVAATNNPYIRIVKIDKKGSCKTIGTIYLKDITSDKRFDYNGYEEKNRRMPVVSLSTTTISGAADLVVNVSLPMLNKSFITNKAQNAVTALYTYQQGTIKQAQKFEFQESDKRIRFSSAVDGNILGDSKNELLIGGYVNEGYSSGDVLGKLNTSYNAIQVVCWSKEKGYYTYFPTMKMVPALSGKGLRVNDRTDMPSLEPACMSTANLYAGSTDVVFLEGKVLSYNEKEGQFQDKGSLGLKGDNKAFIKTAVSGRFSVGSSAKEQIYVISGDHYSGNYDQIYLDISVIYTTSLGEIKADVFRNDFYDKQNEDDNSTWLNFCTVNADKDNVYTRYKGKVAGWSRPEAYAVLQSPPYWKELYYGDQIYAAGSASYSISYGRSTETSMDFGVGLGFGLSARVSAGVGLFGTNGKIGAGINGEIMLSYAGSWSKSNGVEESTGVVVPPGDDYVVLFAVPTVTYLYDIYIPTYTVTQEHIDSYKAYDVDQKGSYDYKVGDTVEGHWEEVQIHSDFEPTFSSMSVDKYNLLIENMDGLKKITSEDLPDKENGDPSTYPKKKEDLQDIQGAENILISKNSATSGRDEAARILGVTFEESETESHTLNLAVDAQVVGTAEASWDFIISAEGTVEIGPKGHLEAGGSVVKSSASGNAFEVTLADYPKDAGDEYTFTTKLGIYNAKQLAPETQKGGGPYVLSYVVTGADEQTVPPMLPLNLKVYNTTAHEIVLNWENPNYRKAGSYEIFRQNSLGSFESIQKVNGNETFVVDKGLDPDTLYRYKVVAYQLPNQMGVKSAMSQIVQGKTKSLETNGPQITRQPDSIGVDMESLVEPTFEVEAKPGNPANTLSYQWQRFEVSSDSVIGAFEDIEGEVSPVYQLPTVTAENKEELDGSVYRVQVRESNGKAVNSRAVTLYVNQENANYIQTQTKIEVQKEDGTPLLQIGNEYYAKESEQLKLSAYVANLETGEGIPSGKVVFGVMNEEGKIQQFGPSSLNEDGTCEVDANLKKGTYRIEAWYLGNVEETAATSKYLNSNSEIMKLSFGQPDSQEEYYFIEYKMDGGLVNSLNPRIFTKDSGIITLHPAADKEGAAFAGWYLDEAYTSEIQTIDTAQADMQKNLVIYARWNETTYPIVYELNGGNNAPENPASYTISTPDIRLKDAVYEGYSFEGWYQEPEYINPVNQIIKGSTGEKKVYAKWTPEKESPVPSPDDGTKYYEIRSVEDLYQMARDVNSGNPAYVNATYHVMNNIDAQGALWNIPIGTAEQPFNGILDGDNYTIHNMTMGGTEQALFHTIGEAGQIKNLRLYTLTGDGNAVNTGSFAIYNKGRLDHCHAGINVDSSIHVNENGQITLDTLNSKLTASQNAGGLVAWNEGSITNCVSSAIVTGQNAGGIAGVNRGVIKNGYNTGAVKGHVVSGGIAGSNQKDGSLFNLYSCGNISGTYTGSIAGKSENTNIEKCYFNSSENEACSNQSKLDATYMRASQMKTKTFAELLNKNIEDEPALIGWYQESERNAGYPRLYNKGMSKTVLGANEYGITISGFGIHRDAKLLVRKLNQDSEIYKQFKAFAPDAEIQQVFDITLVDENGSKLDYDSPLTIQFPIGNGEKMEEIQILHRLDERTIGILDKPDGFETTGQVETKSLSAFAVIRKEKTDENQKPEQKPEPEKKPESEKKSEQNQSQAKKAAKTGDEPMTEAGTWILMIMLAGSCILGVTMRGRIGK